MAQRIVVCTSCEGTDGAAFAARLRDGLVARGLALDVQEHDCLSNCGKPQSLAFAGDGKATYLFGEIDPRRDLDDALAFAAMYDASPDGWIEDARGAGRLRFCLIGRVPAA